MSANNYGTANPVVGPQPLSMGADVALPAGTWTVLLNSSPFVAISPGFYYPVMWFNICLSCGVGGSLGFNAGISVNNGAIQGTFSWDYRTMPANGFVNMPGYVNAAPSSAIWFGSGSTVQLQATAATNPMTALHVGTYALAMLFRAPDQ